MTERHQWSGAPGTFCTKCGNDAAEESMFGCRDCVCDDHFEFTTICPMHREWREALGTGCPPDQAAITSWNAKWGTAAERKKG